MISSSRRSTIAVAQQVTVSRCLTTAFVKLLLFALQTAPVDSSAPFRW